MVDWEMIVAIVMFLTIGGTIVTVAYFRMVKARALSTEGGDYRQLAEEIAASQQAYLDEVRQMNTTLKEIERLLREV